MVKSSRTKASFYDLQFFKIASDKKPFFTHWYRRPGDIVDPCGHLDIPDDYNIVLTFANCLNGEIGSSWICCPLCNQ